MQNAWKEAARAWWERMREAERERDELLQKFEELQAAHDDALLRLAHEPSGNPGEFADLVRERDELRKRCEGLATANRQAHQGLIAKNKKLEHWKNMDEFYKQEIAAIPRIDEQAREDLRNARVTIRKLSDSLASAACEVTELRAKQSGGAGEFAALAKRIAEADEKHPRDLGDGVWAARHIAASNLDTVRDDLRREPTWTHALICELHEAMFEFVCGDMNRLADELLDVATVAMRWRRAVMERGK
jgi:DNA repair exonuclease SbcCD ATPase subunit